MNEYNRTGRRLTAHVLMVLALLICLGITTYALLIVSVSMPDNFFQTGSMELNLNDGKPVIEEYEFMFEPGMTVAKTFFVENKGTDSGFYRLYLRGVSGGLKDVLEVTLCDGEETLYRGTAEDFIKENVKTAEYALEAGERRYLEIIFHFPEEQGNTAQGRTLSFEICGELVQEKNNPDRLFE